MEAQPKMREGKRFLRLATCLGLLLLPVSPVQGIPPSGSASGLAVPSPCKEDVTGRAALSGEACAKTRVEVLRKRLAEAQVIYFQAERALARKGSFEQLAPANSIYLDSQRQHLGAKVIEMLNRNTSGEAVVAILKVEVQSILENIRVYEETLGIGKGALTTEWNVLSTPQLSRMQEQVREDLVALEKQAAPLPDGELRASLSRRIQEVRFQLSALRGELKARTSNAPPVLRAIRPGISTAEARKNHPWIALVDGPGGGKRLQRKLLVEIESRLFYSPEDPSLIALRAELRRLSPEDKKASELLALVREGKGGLPPPSPSNDRPDGSRPDSTPSEPPRPPRPRGPPEIVAELEAAADFERLAVRWDDALFLACARALQARNAGWIRAATGLGLSDAELVLMAQPKLALVEQRQALIDHAVRLERAGFVDNDESWLSLEECRQKIGAIERELARRDLPRKPSTAPRGPFELISRINATARAVEIRAYERGMDFHFQHSYHLELQRLWDRPRKIKDMAVYRELRRARDSERKIREAVVLQARQDLETSWRQLRVDGRGEQGATAARRIRQAQLGLEHPGQELRLGSLINVEQALSTRHANAGGSLLLGVENHSTGMLEPLVVKPRNPVKTRTYSGFDVHFPAVDPRWADWKRAISDKVKAPGGVVIDGQLPTRLSAALQEARVDVRTGALRLRIGDSWKRLDPAVDADTARAAWAFANDRRVVAIDVRNLNRHQHDQLLKDYGPRSLHLLSAAGRLHLESFFTALSAVNLHPALVDSAVGTDLLRLDMMVFDVLKDNDVRLEGDAGLGGRELRNRYIADHRRAQRSPDAMTYLYRKSIVFLLQPECHIKGDLVRVAPKLTFGIFIMPREGFNASAFSLDRTAAWFQENQALLGRHYPEIKRAVRFAATVAVFRAVLDRHVPNNLDDLIERKTAVVSTPRFICRSPDRHRCDRAKIKDVLGVP